MLSALLSLLTRFQRPSKASAPPLGQILAFETQSFAETLARVAESQVGKREEGGNNRGSDVVEYQKATWLPPGPGPWCAAFVCWCILTAIHSHGLNPKWPRPRTAGAYDLEQWAAGKYGAMFGAWAVIKSTPGASTTWPRRGDIITFTWPHVGIVTGYDAHTKRVFTVEGNAGMAQASDSAAGDGVVEKEHHITKTRRLIRYVG